MKLAAATDDGRTIAPDLAEAAYYAVLTIEDGLIAGRELRQKRPQGWYAATGHAEHRGPQSTMPETVQGHDLLVDPIRDCEAVLVSGVDVSALGRLEAAEIWPIVVDPGPIDPAIQALLAGELTAR